jgi:hypothetical protein
VNKEQQQRAIQQLQIQVRMQVPYIDGTKSRTSWYNSSVEGDRVMST